MQQYKQFTLLATFSVLLLSSIGAVLPAFAQTITGTIGVGTTPTNVVYDSNTNEIYVTNNVDNTVSVISPVTHTVTNTITVGNTPVNLLYDPGNHKIYVANNGDGTVSIIDDSTHAVVSTIDLGSVSAAPYGLAYDPDTNRVYVTESTLNQVVVIDDTTNTLTPIVILTNNPFGAVYDFNTKEIYVANNGDSTVSAISGILNIVVAITPVGGSGSGPYGVAYNPSTHEIYSTNSLAGTVSVISDLLHVETSIVTVGSSPLAASYDPVTHSMYVPNIGDGTVSAINDTGHVVTETITLPPNPATPGPYGIVFDPTSNELYVTDSTNNDVIIIGVGGGTTLNPTTTAFASSSNPSTFGQNVTFTATISPSTATGSVTFTIDGTPQPPVSLSVGHASFSTSTLSVGTHTIVVSYSGDTTNAGSTSSTLTQVVNPAPSTSLQKKTGVITDLKSLSPINKHDKKDLQDAISALTNSINPSLWQADGTHLNISKGNKVFEYEGQTVQELTQIIKRGKESPTFVTSLQASISKLVDVDKTLATISISDAVTTSTGYTGKNVKDVHDDILSAQKDVTKASSTTQPDKAIDTYGDAWKQSQDAIVDTTQKSHDDENDNGDDHGGDNHHNQSVQEFNDDHNIGHGHKHH